MSAGAGFSVLIAVGGKPIELERLTDTLESLVHYEPDVGRVVVIDDFGGRHDVMAAVPAVLRTRAVVLPNPRNGRGCGWGAGLAAGILHGLKWCAAHAPGRFVLKFDTDSLAVAPFAERVAARFGGAPEVGLLGTYTRTPRRELNRPEDVPAKPALRKLQRWLTLWRRTHAPRPHLQCALFPRARRVRATIRAAVANGYELGRHCQGGGIPLHADAPSPIACGDGS